MTKAFNPPPHWPEPPRPGWAPPSGWRPDRSWGEVPSGWRLWSDGSAAAPGPAPLAESEDVPASGVPVFRVRDEYPVSVVQPGALTRHEVDDDLHGFDPEPPRRERPRLRLALRITAALLGLLVTAATAYLFVRLVAFAREDLPAQSLAPTAVSAAPLVPTSAGAAGGDRPL